MELIKGASITKLLSCEVETGWRPKPETFDKFCKLLFEAIALLHSRYYVHLDISPNNIIFTGDKIKLIDFGFSCYDKPEKIICEYSASTLNPPENYGWADGDWFSKSSLEERDIWSAAACCLLIYTGTQHDFSWKDSTDTINLLKEKTDKNFPPILRDALSKEPGKRPTAMEVYNALASRK